MPSECVIEHTLLRLQFRGKRVWYGVLSGADALTRATSAKRRLRKKHANGAFANVVHTPDTTSEWAHQLRVLGATCPHCAALAERMSSSAQPPPLIAAAPCFPHGPQRAEALVRLVEDMWRDPESPVWRPEVARAAIVGDRATATSSIWLHDDDSWWLDTVVAALATVPGIDLRSAVGLALVGAHRDAVELVRAAPDQTHRIAAILAQRYLLPVTVRRATTHGQRDPSPTGASRG